MAQIHCFNSHLKSLCWGRRRGLWPPNSPVNREGKGGRESRDTCHQSRSTVLMKQQGQAARHNQMKDLWSVCGGVGVVSVRALVSKTKIKASCLPIKMLPSLLKDTDHTQEQKIKSISVFFRQTRSSGVCTINCPVLTGENCDLE